MHIWLFFLLICLCIAGSIWLRIRRRRSDLENSQSLFLGETKSSQLSIAVQDLIATAGGIYLALIMTVSFLKLSIPQTISLGFFKGFLNQNQAGLAELTFDPLALIAIGLAVIEPAVIKLKNIVKSIRFFVRFR